MGRLWRLAGAMPAYAEIVWAAIAPRAIGGAGRTRVAQAVVRSERGVLLCLRRELRGWELPGGEVQSGERDEEAVVREVREETGLEVAVRRLVGRYQRSGFRAHEAVVFECEVAGGALTTSRETPRVAWFDLVGLPDTIFPWFRAPLDDALAGHAEPVQRTEHQGVAAIAAGARIDLTTRWRGDA
ncbi:MAG: hydrolase [Deltaproteobacteria bacterium]|nr:hydrolase [Deltaproteobacteria bacterium]